MSETVEDSATPTDSKKDTSPGKVKLPLGAKTVSVNVRFSVARIEPDIDGVFLANKAATTIGSAAARSETDLHITGCEHAAASLLTSKPKTMELTSHEKMSGFYEYEGMSGEKTLLVPNRTRLNITTSRVAVGIDGSVVNTMSGQASVALDAIINTQMQRCSSVVPVVYANWMDFSSVVEVSNVKFIDSTTDKEYDSVTFFDNPDVNESCKRAAEALEDVYNQSTETRKAVVFKLAPPLSKSVMRVPFGVDGTTYDLCASVVSRPISMERQTFESMVVSAMKLETNWDNETYGRFMTECSRPGIAASRWSSAAANALSTVVNIVCPYRIDGRVVLTPTGLQMTAAESWKAEASRTVYQTADDCDGSNAHGCAALHDARIVAADKNLAALYPATACFANAFSLHYVGSCVLAANAGTAGNAGKNGEAHVAGHAITLALPRSMVLEALLTGAMSSTQGRSAVESEQLVTSLRSLWGTAMFSQQEIDAMSSEDAEIVSNLDIFLKLHRNASLGDMEALAVEGTSPVSPSLLYSRSPSDRISRRRVARADKKLADKIGPSVARAITQLDVGASNVETDHVFYGYMVEFIVSPHEEIFKDEKLRTAGYATSQFVFAQTHMTSEAGATPKDLATGNFALLPLWKVNSKTGADFDVALKEVQANTMPMRRGVTTMDSDTTEIYTANIKSLMKLHEEASSRYDTNKDTPKSQFIFAMATLMGNKYAVEVFVNRLRKMAVEDREIAVSVDVQPMPTVLFNSEGKDVGKFVVVNAELL
jgi:hypothetical protein